MSPQLLRVPRATHWFWHFMLLIGVMSQGVLPRPEAIASAATHMPAVETQTSAIAPAGAPYSSVAALAWVPAAGEQCYATLDDGGLVYSSTDASALRNAVAAAVTGTVVKIAGTCAGAIAQNGQTQVVYLNKTLTLQGGYTPTNWTTPDPINQPTVLDAAYGGRAVYANAPATLSGLTVRGGRRTDVDGAGIYAAQALTLSNVVVMDNVHNAGVLQPKGGGVYINGAATIINSTFLNNRGRGDGGALYAATTLRVYASTFSGNYTDRHGGAAFSGGNLLLEGVLAQNNFCTNTDCSGGAFRTNGSATLTNTQLIGNFTGVSGVNGGIGGGAYVQGTASITGSTFVSNTATQGGGLALIGAAQITGTTFQGNSAVFYLGNQRGYGGGLYGGVMTLTNTRFVNNSAAAFGGGLNAEGFATLTNIQITDNQAGPFGGGARFFGGALITNSNISNNAATSGGGAFFGGAALVQVVNSLIADNTAGPTGQGAELHLATSGNVYLRHLTLGHYVTTTKPAVYVGSGTVYLTNTLIATHQVGIHRAGGMVSADHTLFSNVLTPTVGAVTNTNALTGNAAFRNPLIGDYHLTADSAARDTAVNAGVSTDFEGEARPAGAGYDIGYDEFNEAAPRLALYVFAFDNDPNRAFDLEAQYAEAIAALRSATLANPAYTAVVLVDRSSAPDAVYEFQHGAEVNITNQWPAMPTEVDATAAAALGGFIQWARQRHPVASTTFTFVGHGLYLAPETDISNITGGSALQATTPLTNIFPLPMHIGTDPQFTDFHPLAVLSVHDLAEALRLGTNDGAAPLDVVDLMQCFGLSLEQAYALRNYTRTLVGAPNYAYFFPPMLAAGLTALANAQTSQTMAVALVNAYDATLPPTEHPRVLAAVDTANLAITKETMDALSVALVAGLNNPPTRADYRLRLQTAYSASVHYDANCNFECAAPDALVDAADFLGQVALIFSDVMPVQQAASVAANAVTNTILTHTQRGGAPWFKPSANWNFANAHGLSLYADLLGLPSGNTTQLNGIAHWYHPNSTTDNPQPFAFVQPGSDSTTWASVLEAHWANEIITTALCLPEFPPALEVGELAALGVTFPLPNWPRVGVPLVPMVKYSTALTIHNPLMVITITQGSTVVFTDVVGLGTHVAGTYQVQATHSWTPTLEGAYTLTFALDIENQVAETHEGDNVFNQTGVVRPNTAPPLPAFTAHTSGDQQWFSDYNIPIVLEPVVGATPPTQALVQVFQYLPGIDPTSQTPVLTLTLPMFFPLAGGLPHTLSVPLPNVSAPGLYVLRLWPHNGGFGQPVDVEINYLPPNSSVAAGAEQFFRFSVNAAENINLTLAAAGEAQLYMWEPNNAWVALATTPGSYLISPTQAGTYVISVYNPTNNALTYTLSATRGAGPLAPQSPTAIHWVTRARPDFLTPLFNAPNWLVYLPHIVK